MGMKKTGDVLVEKTGKSLLELLGKTDDDSRRKKKKDRKKCCGKEICLKNKSNVSWQSVIIE